MPEAVRLGLCESGFMAVAGEDTTPPAHRRHAALATGPPVVRVGNGWTPSASQPGWREALLRTPGEENVWVRWSLMAWDCKGVLKGFSGGEDCVVVEEGALQAEPDGEPLHGVARRDCEHGYAGDAAGAGVTNDGGEGRPVLAIDADGEVVTDWGWQDCGGGADERVHTGFAERPVVAAAEFPAGRLRPGRASGARFRRRPGRCPGRRRGRCHRRGLRRRQ